MDSEQPVEQVKAEPVAWMYHHPGDLEHGWQRFTFERRIQTYEGMSCNEEDAGVIETPLYATPQPAAVDGLVEALRMRDDRVKRCPINKRWLSEAERAKCSKCGATPSESCGETNLADAQFVEVARQALAQIERKPDAE